MPSVRRSTFRPTLEVLEDRRVLAVFPSATHHFLGADTPLAVTGRFNSDNVDDIVALAGSDLVTILSDGNGGHAVAGSRTAAGNVSALAVGYFNADNFQDVAALQDGSKVVTFLADGTGGFAVGGTLDLGGAAQLLASSSRLGFAPFATNLTPDGMHADLVSVVNGELRVLAGDGNGHFSLGAVIDARAFDRILLADLEQNNTLDILATLPGTDRSELFIYRQTGQGVFTLLQPPLDLSAGNIQRVFDLAVGNFRGGTNLDVAVLGGNNTAGDRMLAIVEGGGTMDAPTFQLTAGQAISTTPANLGLRGMATVTANDDEFHDLAVVGGAAGFESVLATVLNGANGLIGVESTSLNFFGSKPTVGDFNDDLAFDVAVPILGGGVQVPTVFNGVSVLRHQTSPDPGSAPGASTPAAPPAARRVLSVPDEPLVPASQALLPLLRSKYAVAYLDIDGDVVVIASRKPIFTGDLNRMFRFRKRNKGYQLERLFLPSGATGTDLHVVAVNSRSGNEIQQLARLLPLREQLLFNLFAPARLPQLLPHLGQGGDNKVHVGAIEAPVPLASVTVDGDLGRIAAGNSVGPAVGILTVGSLAEYGVATQGPDGSLHSRLRGGLTRLTVENNVGAAFLDVTGKAALVEGRIGGSILGGHLRVAGTIESVKVGSAIVGGATDCAGRVEAGGRINNLYVGANIAGQGGKFSGSVEAAGIGKVVVRGKLFGGAGDASGFIRSWGRLDSADVGGIRGAAGNYSGRLEAAGTLGDVIVHGDVLGSAGFNSGSVEGGSVRKITVAGNLEGGRGDWSGVIEGKRNFAVTVLGDVLGGEGNWSGRISTMAGNLDLLLAGALVGGGGMFSGTISTRLFAQGSRMRDGAFPSRGVPSGVLVVEAGGQRTQFMPRPPSNERIVPRGESSLGLPGAPVISRGSGNVISRGSGNVISHGSGN